MTALSVAVLVFSATIFADQSGLLETRGDVVEDSGIKESEEKPAKEKEVKPFRGTGVYKENGKYRFFKNGVFTRKTGVSMSEDGKYRYVKDGIFSPRTGIAKRLRDGKLVYVKKGIFKEATGAAKRLRDGKLLYVKKGVFSQTTDVVKRLNSKYYVYVKKGVFASKKTGLVQKRDKQWVLVQNGVMVTNPKRFFLTKQDERAGRQELLCEVFARTIYNKVVKKGMTKQQRLRACFDYLFPEVHYKYLLNRIPYYTAPDSAIVYTLDMIRDGGSTCHGFGSLFAYLARLCGYKNSYYVWSSYHGWAEVDGLIYDPVFLGEPHNTEVYATPYDVGRGMGLGTNYEEMNRYHIPKFKDKR